MNNFMTLEERESVPTILYGDRIKAKVVDLDKMVEAIQEDRRGKNMSMIITVTAIKIIKHKELSKTISWTRDHTTGIYYGIPFGLHQDGNVKWQKIPLLEHNTFNLNNPDECKKWVIVRMHPDVLGSPFQNADPLFKIYDPDEDAKLQTQRAMLISKAITKAFQMKKEDTLGFHRYLGLATPPDVSPGVIKAEIIMHAQTEPDDFMSKLDNPRRQLSELYFNAKAIGIIHYEIDKGFTYQGQFLGYTDIDSIAFLEEDGILVQSIKGAVEKKDVDMQKFLKDVEK